MKKWPRCTLMRLDYTLEENCCECTGSKRARLEKLLPKEKVRVYCCQRIRWKVTGNSPLSSTERLSQHTFSTAVHTSLQAPFYIFINQVWTEATNKSQPWVIFTSIFKIGKVLSNACVSAICEGEPDSRKGDFQIFRVKALQWDDKVQCFICKWGGVRVYAHPINAAVTEKSKGPLEQLSICNTDPTLMPPPFYSRDQGRDLQPTELDSTRLLKCFITRSLDKINVLGCVNWCDFKDYWFNWPLDDKVHNCHKAMLIYFVWARLFCKLSRRFWFLRLICLNLWIDIPISLIYISLR